MQQILESLFLPPGLQILLFLVGALFWRYSQKTSMVFIFTGIAFLWVVSTPKFARKMMASIEYEQPLSLKNIPNNAQAMVILGSGTYVNAPEFNGIDTVSRGSLERIRFASHIARSNDLPILISGGRKTSKHTPESVAMNQVMVDEFEVYPKWLDTKSLSTMDNAINSKPILARNDIDSIVLVTHAFHMKRAIWSFQQVGISVIPAPMGYFDTNTYQGIREYLPSAKALYTSNQAMKEWVALLSYYLFYTNHN
jgi:uncharacterized SAM-binding protein YcdF (DUF218 family)